MDASVYVHVPFCAGAKCDYCDFYSVPVKAGDERLAAYVDSLLNDAERLFRDYTLVKVPSVYIGGGTPSILGAAGIHRLIDGLLGKIKRFSPPPEEITVEANPESGDKAFLEAAREGGASRLSVGVQSFHGPSRRAVNRAGTGYGEAILGERLKLAELYFPGAFSVDLLSGLPFQDEKVLANDISAALSYKPAHVSLYALTVENGTALAAKKADGSLSLPDDDEADSLWLLGRDLLEKAGMDQYEVSNFCLPGKECRHNIRYWRMENWLALGQAASGTVIDDESGKGFRYTNVSGPDKTKFEELDTSTLIKETILMGFRYIHGPDEALFKRRFHKSIRDLIPKTLDKWQDRLQKEKLALTKDGLLLLNRFLLDAFAEI